MTAPSHSTATTPALDRTAAGPGLLAVVIRWALIVAAANIFLVARDTGTHHEGQYVLGSIFLWASTVPFLMLWLKVPGAGVLLPLVSLVTFIAYGMPIFMHDRIMLKTWLFTESQVIGALEVATSGLIILILGYFLLPVRRLPIALPRVRLKLPLEKMEFRLVAVAIGCVPFKVAGLYWIPPPLIAQPMMVLGNLSLIAIGGLLILALRGQASFPARFVGVAVFITIALAGLGTGMVGNTMRDTAAIAIVYFLERRRWPWRWMIVVAIVIFPFLTTKHEFRKRLALYPTADPVERVTMFIDITMSSLESGKTEVDDMQKTTLDRVNHLATLACVTDSTPSKVPYWGGETYKNALWSIVPRFVYPDKPNKALGQEFGHRYMILDVQDYDTSINLTQFAEMYANFGYYGVLVGTALLGLIYRLLSEALEQDSTSDGAKMIAPLIFAPLLNVESDFGVVFGGIVYATLAYVVALRFLTLLLGKNTTDAREGAPVATG